MNSEDKSWFDGLAGRDGDSAAAREGRVLRHGMQKRAVPQSVEPATSNEREAELVARAMRVDERAPDSAAAAGNEATVPGNETASGKGNTGDRAPGKAFLPSWLFGAGGMLAFASVAVVAIAVTLLMPVTQEETLRGVVATELRIEVDDPGALRLGITEALLDQGVEVEGFSILGDQLLAADLPQPLPAEIAAILARYNLPVPENGELRLRITTREQ